MRKKVVLLVERLVDEEQLFNENVLHRKILKIVSLIHKNSEIAMYSDEVKQFRIMFFINGREVGNRKLIRSLYCVAEVCIVRKLRIQ